ncbi:NADPH-dependent oxidoreductase [bacterium]|nr:NADPH-dependent oxidoreductase [bacterium]
MDILAQIAAHRSIRKYRPAPVEPALLAEILHAATRASSSGNMQTYSIIVTREEARRRELWRLHFEQDMVLEAPLLLTFCVDWRRMTRWCELSEADPGFDNLLSFLVGFADALIAAQNAALAAESRGLGICYMGTTLGATEGLVEFFDLPAGVFPATTLVVGWPDEDPAPRARLPIGGIVHEERYADPDDAGVRAVYRERETEGWKRYESFPELAARMRDSGVKNLAQIYTQLKYTKAENEAISADLLATLARQGFLDSSR